MHGTQPKRKRLSSFFTVWQSITLVILPNLLVFLSGWLHTQPQLYRTPSVEFTSGQEVYMAPPLSIRYSATEDDLFFPCHRGSFFPAGLPDSEPAICAEFCRLTYCNAADTLAFDRPKITGVLTNLGFSVPTFVESPAETAFLAGSGFHALLAKHGGRNLSLLGFRGTNKQDLLNLLADCAALGQPWDRGGQVHAGFAAALGAVRPGLEAAKSSINSRLLITGHSLGAAMATLLASAWNSDFREMALYTFGSPRVGDVAFVTTLKDVASQRYVDCCDGVTEVPPPIPGILYQHVGSPQYIDRKGRVTPDPGILRIGEDRLAANVEYAATYAGRPGNNLVRALADHAPINYVSAVMGIRADARAAAGQ